MNFLRVHVNLLTSPITNTLLLLYFIIFLDVDFKRFISISKFISVYMLLTRVFLFIWIYFKILYRRHKRRKYLSPKFIQSVVIKKFNLGVRKFFASCLHRFSLTIICQNERLYFIILNTMYAIVRYLIYEIRVIDFVVPALLKQIV